MKQHVGAFILGLITFMGGLFGSTFIEELNKPARNEEVNRNQNIRITRNETSCITRDSLLFVKINEITTEYKETNREVLIKLDELQKEVSTTSGFVKAMYSYSMANIKGNDSTANNYVTLQ